LKNITPRKLDLNPKKTILSSNQGITKIKPNSNSISFSFSTPSTAGGAITTLTNTSKWLNFSSAVAPSASRRITAQISGGTVPSGLQLTVLAGTAVTSTGTVGSSSGTVPYQHPIQLLTILVALTQEVAHNTYTTSYSLSVVTINYYAQEQAHFQ
jgi:hypothetical protein